MLKSLSITCLTCCPLVISFSSWIASIFNTKVSVNFSLVVRNSLVDSWGSGLFVDIPCLFVNSNYQNLLDISNPNARLVACGMAHGTSVAVCEPPNQ